jgi:hypothetical protein
VVGGCGIGGSGVGGSGVGGSGVTAGRTVTRHVPTLGPFFATTSACPPERPVTLQVRPLAAIAATAGLLEVHDFGLREAVTTAEAPTSSVSAVGVTVTGAGGGMTICAAVYAESV